MAHKLTVEIFIAGQWQKACSLRFHEPEAGRSGPVTLEYEAAYVARFQNNPAALVSLRYPLDFFPHECEYWPAFLLDILPMGAARRYWGQRLNLVNPEHPRHDYMLLQQGARAPVGNMRIKESCPVDLPPARGFPIAEVLSRDTGFLDYARECGAAVGGASGAGGEAPKFLLTKGKDGLYYPDATLPDDLADEFFLVKFPRQSSHSNRPLDSDLLILETEAAYYQIANRLGFDTICHSPWPLTGSKGEHFFFPVSAENAVSRPSLWLPRFDRRITASAVDRIGVESLYSLVGSVEPGATIAHTEYLRCLVSAWAGHGQQAEVPELVAEYVRRDLLNVVLGNSDNHGRNTSVLRLNNRLQLAPVYDLAPMVLDESGITRTSRWSQANELGGEFNWRGICDEAAQVGYGVAAGDLWDALTDLANQLVDLPRLAEEYQVPLQVLQQRTGKLNLTGTEQRLKDWGLLP